MLSPRRVGRIRGIVTMGLRQVPRSARRAHLARSCCNTPKLWLLRAAAGNQQAGLTPLRPRLMPTQSEGETTASSLRHFGCTRADTNVLPLR